MEPWTVTEFRKSRARTWRAVRPWLFLWAAGIVGSQLVFWINPATKTTTYNGGFRIRTSLSFSDMPLWQINLTFGSFIAMAIAGGAVTVCIRRHYRCPKCETIPTTSSLSLGPSTFGRSWGVALSPTVCSNCGARLR